MPIKKTGKRKLNNGGGYGKKPTKNNKNINIPGVATSAIAKKKPTKIQKVNEDIEMSGTRQSTRNKIVPKKLELTFTKPVSKSGYVRISEIPEKIKEFEKLIEKKRVEIKNYENKIEELRKRQQDEETKIGKIDDISKMFSNFKF